MLDIAGDTAVVNTDHVRKQPDWTYNEEDSGKLPVDLDSIPPDKP